MSVAPERAEPSRDDFEFLARIVRETARNADALAREARLLLDAGHPARALALAIASLEEDGKQTVFSKQATIFDPNFRLSITRRNREVFGHPQKQATAIGSLRSMYGSLPVDEILGIEMPPGPLPDEDVGEVEEQIAARREAALYVDTDGTEVTSPMDLIGRDEARKYVVLAEASARTRRWMHRSPFDEVVHYFEFYRDAYLRFVPDPAPDDVLELAAVWRAMSDELTSHFEFIPDEEGALGGIRVRLAE